MMLVTVDSSSQTISEAPTLADVEAYVAVDQASAFVIPNIDFDYYFANPPTSNDDNDGTNANDDADSDEGRTATASPNPLVEIEIRSPSFIYYGQIANNRGTESENNDELQRHWGTIVYYDGSSYEGQWRENQFDGQGTRFESSQIYQGTFRRDEMHGFGATLYLETGVILSGNWSAEGYVQGRGAIEWSNGDIYRGEILNSTLHGEGCLYYMEGEWVAFFSDKWNQGELLNGEGFAVHESGEIFHAIYGADGTREKLLGQYTLDDFGLDFDNMSADQFYSGIEAKGAKSNHSFSSLNALVSICFDVCVIYFLYKVFSNCIEIALHVLRGTSKRKVKR